MKGRELALRGLSSFQLIGAAKSMFLDITHYDSARKKRASKRDGKREPNGRLLRHNGPDEFMVYFISLDGLPRVKVGRTQNIRLRLRQYRHTTGIDPVCLAQLIVGTLEDSIVLERAAIAYLQSRYERHGREWFEIPQCELANAVSAIVSSSSVTIASLRGMPGAEEPEMSVAKYCAGDAKRVAHSYRAKRSGLHAAT